MTRDSSAVSVMRHVTLFGLPVTVRVTVADYAEPMKRAGGRRESDAV
jgi:hypothetical protein